MKKKTYFLVNDNTTLVCAGAAYWTGGLQNSPDPEKRLLPGNILQNRKEHGIDFDGYALLIVGVRI